MQCKYEHSLLD